MQIIGVSAFIRINNKILIVRRSKNEKFLHGYYEIPGGKIEFGENPKEALIREIKEELNLKIKIIKLYSTFSYVYANNKKHVIDLQYIVELDDDINNLKLSEEHDGYKLISEEELDNYNFSKEMKEVIIKGFEIK